MRSGLREQYERVRSTSISIAEPLSPEDQGVQSMADASPTKWHLAHTTWFFETFLLRRFDRGYRTIDPRYVELFNSYYNSVGAQHPRPARGLLSRPSLREVHAYRAHVDEHMAALLDAPSTDARDATVLGLHHEQQHQELMLTDAKHALWSNPLAPVYRSSESARSAPPPALGWRRFDEGIVRIGHEGEGFSFDNERPCHRVFLEAFEIASRLVTNGEYAEFIADKGYERPSLWLSDGWATVQAERWKAPLYWEQRDGAWWEFSLAGKCPLDPHVPVSHVSFYEAEAFARWAGARLPAEAEWERAASCPGRITGTFLDSGRLAPAPLDRANAPPVAQLFGDVWQWTASPYVGYPRYEPPTGAFGEYNGKFMCNQLVLRGGSCFTPASHIRASYRNFFPPSARWQVSGIRLARWS